MIIKATLVTLVVILVVVIATSYYVNKEGFDDISNSLGSAINTVTPTIPKVYNDPSLTTTSLPTIPKVYNDPSLTTKSLPTIPIVYNNPSFTATSPSDVTMQIQPASSPSDAQKERTLFLQQRQQEQEQQEQEQQKQEQLLHNINMTLDNLLHQPYPGQQEPINADPLEPRYTKMAYDFDKLHDNIRPDINNIVRVLNDTLNTKNSSITVINDLNKRINDIINNTIFRPKLDNNFKFNSPDLNLRFRYLVNNASAQVGKLVAARKIQSELDDILDKPSPENKIRALELLSSVNNYVKSGVDSMNKAINSMNAIKFIEPNNNDTVPSSSTTATPPSTTGSSPTRTDVVPQVSFSDSGYNAMALQQKADILKDIQKVVRNEVLANRSTTPMLYNDSCGGGSEYDHKDDKNGCESVKEPGCGDNTWENECGKKPVKDKITAATSQGKEYENSCYKDKKSATSCPPQPNMAQFIKKDAIPCWGCDLDY